jgi:hypothetical protein
MKRLVNSTFILLLFIISFQPLLSERFIQTYIPYISFAEYPYISGIATVNDYEQQKTVNEGYTLTITENDQKAAVIETKLVKKIDENHGIIWFRYKTTLPKKQDRIINFHYDINSIHNYKGEISFFKSSEKSLVENSMNYSTDENSDSQKHNSITEKYIQYVQTAKPLIKRYCSFQKTNEIKNSTKLTLKFDKVRMRDKPNLSSKTVEILSEGEVVTSQGQLGGNMTHAELRGTLYFSQFILVKTKNGKEGWVFLGTLEE